MTATRQGRNGTGRRRTVLYVSHNHPSVIPGGAETYALELYEAMRESEEFEPILLARTGPPVSKVPRFHEGTLLSRINGDPNQYLFHTEGADFDWFYHTIRSKDVYTKFFHNFLDACRPDIVHFQHTLFLGYEVLRQTRNTLPNVPLVYTLHEYLPICHRNGQMLRTTDQRPCERSSPRRCHECFPEISPQTFFMRERFIRSHLELVDLFLAPSRFLLERYVEWGIPREKIVYEDYGRRAVARINGDESGRRRNRLGFFGQLSFFKGVNVLLEAMKLLGKRSWSFSGPLWRAPRDARPRPSTGENAQGGDARLWVHGANLEFQPESFRDDFAALLKGTERNVRFEGRYEPADLSKLMEKIDWVVVPSVWWENSPLVIQEAFLHGRPVICSDIGGMAEKVADGVNGLHFRAGDPVSLAETIVRAVDTPALWDELRRGIPAVYGVQESASKLTRIYRDLIESRSAGTVSR